MCVSPLIFFVWNLLTFKSYITSRCSFLFFFFFFSFKGLLNYVLQRKILLSIFDRNTWCIDFYIAMTLWNTNVHIKEINTKHTLCMIVVLSNMGEPRLSLTTLKSLKDEVHFAHIITVLSECAPKRQGSNKCASQTHSISVVFKQCFDILRHENESIRSITIRKHCRKERACLVRNSTLHKGVWYTTVYDVSVWENGWYYVDDKYKPVVNTALEYRH